MGGGAAGEPGALAAGLVDGEEEQGTAPATTQLHRRGEKTAWGQARLVPEIAMVKTVILV